MRTACISLVLITAVMISGQLGASPPKGPIQKRPRSQQLRKLVHQRPANRHNTSGQKTPRQKGREQLDQQRRIVEANNNAGQYITHSGLPVLRFGHFSDHGYIGPKMNASHSAALATLLGHVTGETSAVESNVLLLTAMTRLLQGSNKLAMQLGIPPLRGLSYTTNPHITMKIRDGILTVGAPRVTQILHSLSSKNWNKKEHLEKRPLADSDYFHGFDSALALFLHQMGHHLHQHLRVKTPADYTAPPLEREFNVLREKHGNNLQSPTLEGDENLKNWFASNFAMYKMNRFDLLCPQWNILFNAHVLLSMNE